MVFYRGREDPLNSVIAGFTTGFVLAVRGGLRNAIRSGIIGGIFLGIIEIMMVIYGQRQKRMQVEMINQQIQDYKREIARRSRMGKSEDIMADTANRL